MSVVVVFFQYSVQSVNVNKAPSSVFIDIVTRSTKPEEKSLITTIHEPPITVDIGIWKMF